DGLEAGARGTVISLQLMGLTADLVRAGVLTLIAFMILSPIANATIGLWTTDARLSRSLVVATVASVAAGAAWKLFHATAGARWFFVGGLAVGLVILFPKLRPRRTPRLLLRFPASRRRRRSPSCRSRRGSRSSCACSPFGARGTTRACSATASAFASSRRFGCSRRGFIRSASRRRWRAKAT